MVTEGERLDNLRPGTVQTGTVTSSIFICKEARRVPGLSSGLDPTFQKVLFALLTEAQSIEDLACTSITYREMNGCGG